jgi:hypothetical protein
MSGRLLLAAGLLAAASAVLAGPARLDVSVTLDPATRELRARGTVTVDRLATELALNALFAVDSIAVDGRRLDPAGTLRDGRRLWRLPAADRDRRVEIEWRGTLAALEGSVSHRDSLRNARPVADPRGSFLPAASFWHPIVAHGFSSYRVALDLPTGQKGVVPGTLVAETEADGRYRARLEFPYPSDGVDLMAGPYRVEQRDVVTAGGRPVRLRTYFDPSIADLAGGYLDSVKGYLDLYEGWIGEYPFGEFSVVSSPTPTGFGMPTLTYLGVDVLRLPFIRATSLGHEVLHNWWGNGVFADYARGNWSEGLTTFMADYAYKEREGEEAARTMRLEWLRDFAALPAAEDRPLAEFTARYHGASQIVGYNKAAMVFLMLRDRIGREAFDAALRRFWREHRFKVASWSDLRRAFEAESGAGLEPFFAQWLMRAGAPDLRIAGAEVAPRGSGYRLRVALEQGAPAYRLRVPLVVRTPAGDLARTVEIDQVRQTVTLDLDRPPLAVVLDPDVRLFRRLGPDEAPPILRGLMVDPATTLVVVSPALEAGAKALAARLLDHPPRRLGAEAAPTASPLLVVGLRSDVDAWLARTGLGVRPAQAERGDAQVWMAGRDKGAPLGVVSVRDAEALAAVTRAAPHYGRSSWLALEGGRVVARGTWPGQPQSFQLGAASR